MLKSEKAVNVHAKHNWSDHKRKVDGAHSDMKWTSVISQDEGGRRHPRAHVARAAKNTQTALRMSRKNEADLSCLACLACIAC